MNTETQKTAVKKVQLSGKVPPDIKDKVLRIAQKEDRSLSYILTRLLSSHPDLKNKKSLALQS
jgi:predicted transcriptional regulator